MDIVQEVDSDETPAGVKHKLFVEGFLDAEVMKLLLPRKIRVEILGGSIQIRNVAKSVYRNRKNYYFLVDRDHHSDNEVSHFRDTFSDQTGPNILMWNLREIENYFIKPDFLINSSYLIEFSDKLESEIKNIINKNYLIDAANHAIGDVVGLVA